MSASVGASYRQFAEAKVSTMVGLGAPGRHSGHARQVATGERYGTPAGAHNAG